MAIQPIEHWEQKCTEIRQPRQVAIESYLYRHQISWKQLDICDSQSTGTAVIPALNEADGITATLHSLEKVGGMEAIVVDNGSTDDTVGVP